MVDYNIFRVLGDVSHALSKCILIWAIISNKSAEGVSLITQSLYLIVFGIRYMDLFWTRPSYSYWNFVLKIFYISSSAFIVFLMMRLYARTREREKAWKLGGYSLGGSFLAAPLVCLIFEGARNWGIFESLYTFSLILEAFCILPQLLLLRQTTVPTVIDSFYLITLGSYRFLYILNWILRSIKGNVTEAVFPTQFTFGVIQTAFYFDFAWVYWTRQRVKLRGGGVVDGEDLSRGWLVSRIIGRRSIDESGRDAGEREGLARQEEGTIRQEDRGSDRWGARGISVSADEGVHDLHPTNGTTKGGMTDPADFEDDDEGDAAFVDEPAVDGDHSGVLNGEEWREGR